MNFKFTCMANDGFTKTVTAASKDEAVTMFLADADVTAHVASTHPEMAGKTPEEMKTMMDSMVTMEMGGESMPPAGGAAM